MEQTNHAATARRLLSNAILALIFVYAIANTVLSVLLNHVIDAFSLSGAQEGLMGSLFGFGCMAALLTTPLLQGRVKKTTMLCIGGLLMVTMMAATGAFHLFPLVLACQLLLGMSCGWIDTYANSTIVDLQGSNSPKYLGALHGMYGVGSLLTPLVITALLLKMGWRPVYFVLAGISLAVVVVFLLISAKARGAARGGAGVKEYRLTPADIAAYIKKPRNLLLLVASFFNSIIAAGIAMWVVRYYALQFHMEALGATAISAYWICGTVSRFLSPRLPIRPLTLFIAGNFGASLTLAIGLLSNQPIVMLIMCGLNGLVSAACLPMLLLEGAKGYEGGTLLPTSMLLLTMDLGRALTPLLMGALTASVSVSFAMYVTAATGILSGLAALAVLPLEHKKRA